MAKAKGWWTFLTGPWASLALLLLGLAVGTWLPSVGGIFSGGVDLMVRGLVLAAPVIILVSILPALLGLFATGAGKAPLVVIGLFTLTTVVAGIFALLVAWVVFQLPLTSPDGGAGASTLSGIGPSVTGSAPVFALMWSFGSAIILHGLLVLGRRVRTTGNALRRGLGAASYVAAQTVRVFNYIGSEGIAKVGRGLEYALPFILFAVGTFVPTKVQEAAAQAGQASSSINAVPAYLLTAGLIGLVTGVYLLGVAWASARFTGRSLKKVLKVYVPPVYAFAWATSSSTATIPVNLEAAGRGLDVRKDTREFVIPLGATINLDGTMIAAILLTPVVTSAIGIDISLSLLIVTMAPLLILTAGAPGLPAGISIIAPPIIADILGLTGGTASTFIGLWFAFSLGLTDQFRTGVNSVNNGVLCMVVERLLGPRKEPEDADPTGARLRGRLIEARPRKDLREVPLE